MNEIQRYRFRGKSTNDELGNYNLSNSGVTWFDTPRPIGAQNAYVGYWNSDKLTSASNPYSTPSDVHSMACWVYPTTTGTGWDIFMSYGGNTANNNFAAMGFNNAGTFIYCQGFNSGVTCSYSRQPNEWHHVCVVYHGGYISTGCIDFYVDGVKQGGKTVAGASKPSAFNNNQSHGKCALYSLNMLGYMWDLRGWDDELSDAEVKRVYRQSWDQGLSTNQIA